jgi:uncharacterized membrane-anchored protein YhcB (DUF1043 family)
MENQKGWIAKLLENPEIVKKIAESPELLKELPPDVKEMVDTEYSRIKREEEEISKGFEKLVKTLEIETEKKLPKWAKYFAEHPELLEKLSPEARKVAERYVKMVKSREKTLKIRKKVIEELEK